ncbi:amidohydrolase family protein [Dyadobacter sp. 32]|uniref:amidohydrolase family protein n=1 Tax=Dyadobacter sp. 32 TaxID=538966 RepID=UPI0011EE3040
MRLVHFLITLFLVSACHRPKSVNKGARDERATSLLLKDYRPNALHKAGNSQVKKAKFPIIDLHSHEYPETTSEIDEWVKRMDRLGVDKTVLLTGRTGAKFDSVFQVYSKYKDRFILFCGFDYTGYDKPGFGPAAVKELERCFNVGAKGAGELGDKGWGEIYSLPVEARGMHIDDPRMKPLLEKCEELDIPISIHVADPIWMYAKMDSTNDGLMNAFKWRLDNRPGIVDHSGMMKILTNAVAAHPGVTFIACHLANCSYDLDQLGAMFDQYPNLYADNAAQYAETSAIPRTAARFYEKYADRLLYGTDMGTTEGMYLTTFRILETEDEHFYDREISGYHWAMHGFALNDKVLDKIYRRNAMKILKLPISSE